MMLDGYVAEELENNLIKETEKQTMIYDNVNNPYHYTNSNIEVIDYIEDKKLGFCLGNAIKYISRSGLKHSSDKSITEKSIEDLKKAIWYINRRIFELENNIIC